MSREVEFESNLTDRRVEHAYGVMQLAHEQRRVGFAETGWRAARARDVKLLKALERMAEVTGKLQDRQLGRTIRDPGATFGETRGTTDHQMCREAYKSVDEGRPIEQFSWVYGAAAYLCGYNL